MLFLSACANKTALNEALSFSGNNRKELQKVIDYYSKRPEDSLKLKAAFFLIENMPYHNFIESTKLDIIKRRLYSTAKEKNVYAKEALSLIEKEVGGVLDHSDFVKKNDAKTIPADYLINNIEHAFMAWGKSPWKNNVTFHQFCREILPYRVGNEPIENWREPYYKKYKPILDSLLLDNNPITACQLLYDFIVKEDWLFTTELNLPHLGALTLLNNRIGGCVERSDFAVYVMRSLGIPGGVDIILQNPDKMYAAHSWNYVTDTLGNHVDFTLYEHRPEFGVRDTNRKKGKVYRLCFDTQPNSLPFLYPKLDLPATLNSVFLSDVSAEYFNGYQLSFSIGKGSSPANKLLYLSVFNNKQWIPIAWTTINNGKATFGNVESSIAYLPTYLTNTAILQADYPVIITKEGEICNLIPDMKHTRSVALYRKHPIPNWWAAYSLRAKNGKFQGANNEAFRDATTFHVIQEEVEMKYHSIHVNSRERYRYVRYLSSDSSYCNMAEIKFLSNDSVLSGKVIGTNGSYKNNASRTKHAVFDPDPLTFYDATEASGSWVGMDLGKPKYIHQIKYLFRNDDNNIRKGDQYELFYYSKNGTASLGKQTGTDEGVLIYENVPSNVLLLLHNHTRGREERIFTYEDGRQKWW